MEQVILLPIIKFGGSDIIEIETQPGSSSISIIPILHSRMGMATFGKCCNANRYQRALGAQAY